MNVSIEISDEKVQDLVAKLVAEELLDDVVGFYLKDDKFRRNITYRTKQWIENIFAKNQQNFEEAVVTYVKERLRGSFDHKNGRLRKVLEKALNEIEEEEE